MGGFFVVHRTAGGDRDGIAARLSSAFVSQGFKPACTLDTAHWRIGFFDRLCDPTRTHAADCPGNQIFCAGTLFYGKAFGPAALTALLADAVAGRIDHEALWGSFAVAIARGGRVSVFTDRTGTLHLYSARRRSVLSTSFLALAEALPRVTVADDAVFDYVLQGAPHGGSTVFQEIELVEAGHRTDLSDRIEGAELPAISPDPRTVTTLDNAAAACLSILRDRVGAVAEAFGDRIDTALSGGYDSRLLLALLRERGTLPRIHVYGTKDDPDVRVARRIAAGEGFALDHIDKSILGRGNPDADLDALAGIVERNCLAFDGYPNDGLFNTGGDLLTRRRRCEGGAIALNGGGGEVLRDFFHMPDRPVDVLDLVRSFFSQFDPRRCAPGFDEAGYIRSFGRKILRTLGVPGPMLSRMEVEAAYPLFRCRYWMGRNNSVNNRFGFALTPYVEPALIARCLAVPLDFKVLGRMQARMIELADPRLAAYPSTYGHAFDRAPPLGRRLAETALRLRPPELRRYGYRLGHRRVTVPPPTLAPERLGRVIGPAFEYLDRWFILSDLRDAAQFNRISSLEYLFQRLNAWSAGAADSSRRSAMEGLS